MKVLSLKLRDDVFLEVEKVVRRIHIPRNAYINEALALYNKLNQRKLLRARLRKESKATGQVSMEVLREFERMEEVPD